MSDIHGGVPLSLLGHSQKTCFFSVRRGQIVPSGASILAWARVQCRVPASARRPPPCPVPSPPATWRWLRASRSTLALAWLAVHIGRAVMQITQAWRAAVVRELRRCAASVATSLPTANSLGSTQESSRSHRRGRAVHSCGGCVVAAFHRWLQCHRSADTLRARAVAEAGRGQHDLLVMAGESRAARWRAGGSAGPRSGSQHLVG